KSLNREIPLLLISSAMHNSPWLQSPIEMNVYRGRLLTVIIKVESRIIGEHSLKFVESTNRMLVSPAGHLRGRLHIHAHRNDIHLKYLYRSNYPSSLGSVQVEHMEHPPLHYSLFYRFQYFPLSPIQQPLQHSLLQFLQ